MLELSTMQMSQQPKIGPLSGLHATANWARFRLNFYLNSNEKMKELNDLSAAQCFCEELHGMGVNPPIFFPYYVSIKVIVLGIPSHFLWNSIAEKLF
jgi:hypothetical protein